VLNNNESSYQHIEKRRKILVSKKKRKIAERMIVISLLLSFLIGVLAYIVGLFFGTIPQELMYISSSLLVLGIVGGIIASFVEFQKQRKEPHRTPLYPVPRYLTNKKKEAITKEAVMIPCSYCGGLMSQTSISCPYCGARRKA